jgi:hypothetical protein
VKLSKRGAEYSEGRGDSVGCGLCDCVMSHLGVSNVSTETRESSASPLGLFEWVLQSLAENRHQSGMFTRRCSQQKFLGFLGYLCRCSTEETDFQV